MEHGKYIHMYGCYEDKVIAVGLKLWYDEEGDVEEIGWSEIKSMGS